MGWSSAKYYGYKDVKQLFEADFGKIYNPYSDAIFEVSLDDMGGKILAYNPFKRDPSSANLAKVAQGITSEGIEHDLRHIFQDFQAVDNLTIPIGTRKKLDRQDLNRCTWLVIPESTGPKNSVEEVLSGIRASTVTLNLTSLEVDYEDGDHFGFDASFDIVREEVPVTPEFAERFIVPNIKSSKAKK